jgi:hypothetical protein
MEVVPPDLYNNHILPQEEEDESYLEDLSPVEASQAHFFKKFARDILQKFNAVNLRGHVASGNYL